MLTEILKKVLSELLFRWVVGLRSTSIYLPPTFLQMIFELGIQESPGG